MAACSRAGAREEAVERIAILPFENLTTSTDLDWVGGVSAAILAYDLTGPRSIHSLRVDSIRDARLNGATHTMEGYLAREQGALAFHATLANRTIVVRAADDIVGALNRLAKDVSPDARALPGCDEAALRAYGEAAAPAGSACVLDDLRWSETLLARGDRDGASRVCEAGLALPRLDPIDRGQLEFLCAVAKGDAGGRLRALERLVKELPADPELLRNAGNMQFASRQFQAAANSFAAATRANPEDAELWNALGYSRAQLHDLAGARAALEQYQKLLPPENANGADSLGEVSFFLGDFAAAERYFLEAYQKDPQKLIADLVKAAQARMMTGDLAGADAIMDRFSGWPPLQRAQWEFITGRRKRAMARLQGSSPNDAAALQLAIWKAQTGQGPVPAAGNDAFSQAVMPLLAGRFGEALPLLEQVYRASSPGSDGQVRTLLAWAYARLGRKDAAAKLVDLYVIPWAASGDNTFFASLVFPRFVELRGELLGVEGDRKLARQYAGDVTR